MTIPNINTPQPNAPDQMPDDLIESKEAAQLAKITTAGLWRWVLKGQIRGWRRSGRLFVSRSELMAMFKRVQPTFEKRREDKEKRAREREARHKGILAAIKQR